MAGDLCSDEMSSRLCEGDCPPDGSIYPLRGSDQLVFRLYAALRRLGRSHPSWQELPSSSSLSEVAKDQLIAALMAWLELGARRMRFRLVWGSTRWNRLLLSLEGETPSVR